jgi:phage-related protein
VPYFIRLSTYCTNNHVPLDTAAVAGAISVTKLASAKKLEFAFPLQSNLHNFIEEFLTAVLQFLIAVLQFLSAVLQFLTAVLQFLTAVIQFLTAVLQLISAVLQFLSAVLQFLSRFRTSWKHFLAQYEAVILKLWTFSPNALFPCQAKNVDFSHPPCLYVRPNNNLT